MEVSRRHQLSLHEHASQLQDWSCCLGTMPLRAARPAVSALLPLVPRHDAFGRHLLLLLRKLLVAPSRSGRALGAHAYCALLSQRLLPDEAAQRSAEI